MKIISGDHHRVHRRIRRDGRWAGGVRLRKCDRRHDQLLRDELEHGEREHDVREHDERARNERAHDERARNEQALRGEQVQPCGLLAQRSPVGTWVELAWGKPFEVPAGIEERSLEELDPEGQHSLEVHLGGIVA